MARWSSKLLIGLLAVLLLPSVFADSIFTSFEILDINSLLDFYQTNPLLIDGILIITLFVLISKQIGEKGPAKHLGSKPMIIVGVILGLSFVMWERQAGFTLFDFY